MKWRATVVASVGLVSLAACGGGSTVAAAPSPDELQSKMAIVQQQFKAEQDVLAKNDQSILNIVSGGGAQTPATLLDVLLDPTIALRAMGEAAEATPPDALVQAWGPHADEFCSLGPADWNDDFFLVYGGAHVLPAMVAFLDASCGLPTATELVAAAKARGLGEGMVASGNPDAGVDLDALLQRLAD